MSESAIIEKLKTACAIERGVLTIIRLDNYEIIRDTCGEEMGDVIRDECIRIIDSFTESGDTKAFLGNDEFVVFYNNIKTKIELAEIYFHIVKGINDLIADVSEYEVPVNMGVSMGAVMVPEHGNDYEELFAKAARVLEYVRNLGGHNIGFYDPEIENSDKEKKKEDPLTEGAMWLDEKEFRAVRQFLSNYNSTYKSFACEIDITFSFTNEEMDMRTRSEIIQNCGVAVNHALRKSDAMTVSGHTLHLLLPEMNHQYMPRVLNRIRSRLEEMEYGNTVNIVVDSKITGTENESLVRFSLAV